jgi:HK97 family phage prohead protease
MSKETKLPDDIETRYLRLDVRTEKRADEKMIIKGQAAIFNQETVIRGWFREQIKPGAFQRVLSESPDTIGCFNHDWNVVLGRTTAGTLLLQESPDGLDYEIEINPDDPEALSVYAKVARGDVSQSSFAFQVGKEEWFYPPDNSTELPLRTVTEFSQLYDVCPATFGAYPQTSAAVRSKLQSVDEPAAPSQAASSGVEEIAQRQKAMRRRLDLVEHSISK